LFVALIIPFSYEDKRLHNIEQRTIDASIGQWYSWLKTRICADGNILNTWGELIDVEKKTKNGTPREHLP